MFFKSLPFYLFLCLAFTALCGDFLSLEVIRSSYTISCVFKELLLIFLPLVIFSYISTAILSLDKQAPLLLFAIIGLVTFSNAMGVLVSYGAAYTFLTLVKTQALSICTPDGPCLTPYFSFHLPQLISADKMMVFAVAFGLLFGYLKVQKVLNFSLFLQNCVTKVMLKVFIPLLPFYILGYTLKMKHEGGLNLIFENYGGIFMIICGVTLSYITLAYVIGSALDLKKTFSAMQNMLPAGITGFSTMSSAVTMPVTLASTHKNIENQDYVRLVIPTTVNIHMMADAVALPLLTFGVMQLFAQPIPSFTEFLLFIPAFCLAKFSLASIPGGTSIVMLPVLQSHFNLVPEAASFTTLYILQDPLFTCGNVMGNGAFALLSHRFLERIKSLRRQTKSS